MSQEEEEVLKKLIDIHRYYLPSEPPFWPPAPGFWLIAFLSLLLLLFVFLLIYRACKDYRAKTRFWQQVEDEWEPLKKIVDSNKRFFYYSIFVRRLTKALYGAKEATLQGQAWEDFLKKSSNDRFALPHNFSWEEGLYCASSSAQEAWFKFIEQWVKRQKRLKRPIHRCGRKQIKQSK